jgi:hypothetical protein
MSPCRRNKESQQGYVSSTQHYTALRACNSVTKRQLPFAHGLPFARLCYCV